MYFYHSNQTTIKTNKPKFYILLLSNIHINSTVFEVQTGSGGNKVLMTWLNRQYHKSKPRPLRHPSGLAVFDLWYCLSNHVKLIYISYIWYHPRLIPLGTQKGTLYTQYNCVHYEYNYTTTTTHYTLPQNLAFESTYQSQTSK